MKIIVMQTHYQAEMWCAETLAQLGLKEGEYVVLGDSFGLEEHIIPDTRQLFITGSFSGNKRGIAELVVKLRKKNSKLIAASYSHSGSLPGPFDFHISKDRDDSGFENTVQDFLSGKLEQASDYFWSPAAMLVEKIQSGEIPRKFVVVSRNTETLKAVKQSVAEVDAKRAEEIFFTQSPHEAVSFVGKSTTAVVITTDLFREEFDKNMHPWGGPNLASILSDIKWPNGSWGFSNIVLRYGWNPEPHQALQGVIKRPESESGDPAKHILLSQIITSFPRRFAGGGVSGLLKELDEEMVKKFPSIDRRSCLNLRPLSL